MQVEVRKTTKWAEEVLVTRLPVPLKKALRLRAREEGVSMNTLVIESLADDLDVTLDPPPREHGRPTK